MTARPHPLGIISHPEWAEVERRQAALQANDNDRPWLETIADYQVIDRDDDHDEPEELRNPWPGIVRFGVALALGLAAVLAQVIA